MTKVREIQEGAYVKSIYLCEKKQVKNTKRGDEYFCLILKDDTGSIAANMFDIHPQDYTFTENSFLYVEGRASSYEGILNLKLDKLRLAKEEEYNISDFMPKSKYEISTLYRALLALIEQVENENLKKLLELFFKEDMEFQKAFCTHSDSLNRPYIGGLLESTLWVANFAKFLLNKYSPLNKDLLLTGALLCKVGRVRQMTAFPENAYTATGRLYGMVHLTVQMIEERMNAIEFFDTDLRMKLIHMLLASRSRSSDGECGSIVAPMTLEAHLLSSIIELDSKAVQITQVLEKGADMGADFSPYNALLGANYYLK